MSKQSAADLRYGRRGATIVHERQTTCCHCGKTLPPGRFLFCDAECRTLATNLVREGYLKSKKRADEIGDEWPPGREPVVCLPCETAELNRLNPPQDQGK